MSFLWSRCERHLHKVFRKKTSFSLVCMNVWHHVDKKALCSMSVLQLECMSTSDSFPVFTAVIKFIACADAFTAEDHEYFLNKLPFPTWRSCDLSPLSGKWIVLAVVTRFFASVLVWIFATLSDRSIHNPRRNWHEAKHFMKVYSSAPVVKSTVLFILWLSNSIKFPYDILSFVDRSRDYSCDYPWDTVQELSWKIG